MAINTMRLAAWMLAFLVAASAPSRALAQSAQASQKIDLNTASVQTLETLPGVTAEVANQIIAHRPDDSLAQFRHKSGLSDGQSDKSAPLVTVQAAGPVRQPELPPGATPISPESFSKDSSLPPGAGPARSLGEESCRRSLCRRAPCGRSACLRPHSLPVIRVVTR